MEHESTKALMLIHVLTCQGQDTGQSLHSSAVHLWVPVPNFRRVSQKEQPKTEERGSWEPPADGKVRCPVGCQETLLGFLWKPVCQMEES